MAGSDRPPLVEVRCRGGCGAVHRIPATDPAAQHPDRFECGSCRLQHPTFIPLLNQRGKPAMSKKESAARPGREQRSVTPRLPKAEPTPCLCGCELPTNNDYAQGHDARHVSNLFYEVVGGQRSRSSALRQLKSASLKTKLAARLDRHAAKAKAAKEESDDE